MQGQRLSMATLAPLMEGLEKRWNIAFKDVGLITQAFVHPSVAQSAFQRLEFLGDRVLGLVISTLLYSLLPQEEEGALAKRFAVLVARNSLYQVASTLGLEKILAMNAAAKVSEGPPPRRMMADACEALLGALYLDQGFAITSQLVEKEWMPLLCLEAPPPTDPKSALQEHLQHRGLAPPEYQLVAQEGPSHFPLFTMQAILGHMPHKIFQATAGSKREAQQKVAHEVLAYLTGPYS